MAAPNCGCRVPRPSSISRAPLLALHGAPLEALVVPRRHLVHVHANDPLTGLRAAAARGRSETNGASSDRVRNRALFDRVVVVGLPRVDPRATADGHARVWRGILRKAAQAPQQPVRGAHPLAHKRGVCAVVVPTPPKLGATPPPRAIRHAANHHGRRDKRRRKGPRRRHHRRRNPCACRRLCPCPSLLPRPPSVEISTLPRSRA